MNRRAVGTKHVKIRLVEVDYTIHVPITGTRDWHQVKIQAGLHGGKLSLAFAIGGTEDVRDCLPAALVDGIQQSLDYAAKHVRVEDLVEIDPEPEIEGEEEGDR